MAAHNLAPKKLLEVLQDFANTQAGPERVDYFLKRRPEFLEGFAGAGAPKKLTVAETPMGTIELHTQLPGETPFQELQRFVRWAWQGTDTAFAVLLSLAPSVGKNGIVIPDHRLQGFRYEPRTNLQAAVYQLLKSAKKARVCPNPDCPAPYFLTDDHRTKFCGRKECERPFTLETKRKSFHKHKKKWRKRKGK